MRCVSHVGCGKGFRNTPPVATVPDAPANGDEGSTYERDPNARLRFLAPLQGGLAILLGNILRAL